MALLGERGQRRGRLSRFLLRLRVVACADAAAQDEVLAVGGFEFAAQPGGLVAVTASEVGQLCGEGSHYAAGALRAGGAGWFAGTAGGLGALRSIRLHQRGCCSCATWSVTSPMAELPAARPERGRYSPSVLAIR